MRTTIGQELQDQDAVWVKEDDLRAVAHTLANNPDEGRIFAALVAVAAMGANSASSAAFISWDDDLGSAEDVAMAANGLSDGFAEWAERAATVTDNRCDGCQCQITEAGWVIAALTLDESGAYCRHCRREFEGHS